MKRLALWDLLSKINKRSGLPWCVIRDFNEMLTQDEKIGGRLRPLKQMEAFRVALEVNGLFDLAWVNHKYTWSNRHQDNSLTCERLDLAVANQQWLHRFCCLGVEILTATRSNHQPLLHNIRGPNNTFHQRRRIFRFEASWALNKGGEDIIQLV